MNTVDDALGGKWSALWDILGLKWAWPSLGLITKQYGEPHRKYHTIHHIEHCIGELTSARGVVQPHDFLLVNMAVWYHDVVYDTHRTDNEEKSARFAHRILQRYGLPQVDADRVAQMILATKHIGEVPADVATQVLLDVDLSFLGAPWDRYLEGYELRIREEYFWVSDTQFAVARAQFLRSLLSRERIFFTDTFRVRYEAQARENVNRAIVLLEAQI
jgi:predicted metal-dependent HD superfamily phosphohydrolase